MLVLTSSEGGAMAWWSIPRTPDAEVGVRAPLGLSCFVLDQEIFTPIKSTGNTQEAVAPSQQDGKIVYRDVKHQTKPKKKLVRNLIDRFSCNKADIVPHSSSSHPYHIFSDIKNDHMFISF